MQFTGRQFKTQRGMSLVSVMIATAIAGVVFLVTSQGIVNIWSAKKRVERLDELTSLRSYIGTALSCQNTLIAPYGARPAACYGNFIDVYDSRGRKLISSSGTKFESWHVAAQCTPTGIDIQAARLARAVPIDFADMNPRDFDRDPLTNKPNFWQPLFPVGAEPCRDSLVTPQVYCTSASPYAQVTSYGADYCQGRFNIPGAAGSITAVIFTSFEPMADSVSMNSDFWDQAGSGYSYYACFNNGGKLGKQAGTGKYYASFNLNGTTDSGGPPACTETFTIVGTGPSND
jgi:hypothetical protein